MSPSQPTSAVFSGFLGVKEGLPERRFRTLLVDEHTGYLEMSFTDVELDSVDHLEDVVL